MDARALIGVGVIAPSPPLRLDIDADALVANWRWFAGASSRAACGAAIKADAYGLGARAVMRRLADAGCRDFFVATWGEAAALGAYPDDLSLSVLHGLREDDLPAALAGTARPVLNSPAMVARWKAAAGGRACDVMVDTGMNRLGLSPEEARSGLLDGLQIDTLLSHLACADEPGHPLNEQQLFTFRSIKAAVPARRYSLANSAGICLGQRYAFGLTRPGLGLYGGIPAPGAEGHVRRVVRPHAQVIQVRIVAQGATIGYGAAFTAPVAMRVAILNIGYADGYLRAFGDGRGHAIAGGVACPLLGRVSMDLIAVDVSAAPSVGDGDWLEIEYDLVTASIATGLTQYELLTMLGHRYQRRWI
ncbi:alanine racemase [Sphingomonas sp. KC8]|uniref:alanine racemase n=1 Tax=Sphingomonas sp. KC8 TaxID=1030157 RepID=UPI0002488A76|nr:alanine racemase [Sphingomonas sp. KC8]ARS25847.1 alanine racemase [Sphingomonas sp. KC8]